MYKNLAIIGFSSFVFGHSPAQLIVRTHKNRRQRGRCRSGLPVKNRRAIQGERNSFNIIVSIMLKSFSKHTGGAPIRLMAAMGLESVSPG